MGFAGAQPILRLPRRSIQHRDRLDLDHQVGMRQAPHLDGRAGRQRLAEDAGPHVGMLEELVDVGDVGRGLDQVVGGRAGLRQRDTQVLAHLADLRTHVARTDDVAVAVARELAGDEHQALSRRHDHVRVQHVILELALKQALRLNSLLAHRRPPIPSARFRRPAFRHSLPHRCRSRDRQSSTGALPMTSRNTPSGKFSRRAMLRAGAAAAAGLGAPWITSARAAPVNIRYATGGGIGPNEMETIIWLDHLKQNVLKNYNKAYTLDMTFTRGSPEAAQLLAAGQVQIAALSSPAFATTIAKDAVPDGLSIISDIYQDGHTGYASNTFFVLKDSPIAKVADLKGKKVAINAFGSAVDLVLRVALKKAGLDPRRDVQIVEVT